MTLNQLLNIRAIESSILIIVLLTLAISCFLTWRRHNGVYIATGLVALMGAAYVSMVLFVSLVDVASLPQVRYSVVVVWDIFGALLIMAVFWLGYIVVQND